MRHELHQPRAGARCAARHRHPQRAARDGAWSPAVSARVARSSRRDLRESESGRRRTPAPRTRTPATGPGSPAGAGRRARPGRRPATVQERVAWDSGVPRNGSRATSPEPRRRRWRTGATATDPSSSTSPPTWSASTRRDQCRQHEGHRRRHEHVGDEHERTHDYRRAAGNAPRGPVHHGQRPSPPSAPADAQEHEQVAATVAR